MPSVVAVSVAFPDASTSVAVICLPAVTSTLPFAAFTCVSVTASASFSVMFPVSVVSAVTVETVVFRAMPLLAVACRSLAVTLPAPLFVIEPASAFSVATPLSVPALTWTTSMPSVVAVSFAFPDASTSVAVICLPAVTSTLPAVA